MDRISLDVEINEPAPVRRLVSFSRIGWAIPLGGACAGLIVSLSTLPSRFYAAALVGFGLFLTLIARSKSPRHAALLGFAFGAALIGSAYFWINSFIRWTGPWALVFWIVLALYHALIVASFAAVLKYLGKDRPIAASCLIAPSLWTLTELLGSLGPLGLPETIGHMQVLNPFLSPSASLLGVNYLSFLAVSLAAMSVLLASATEKRERSGAASALTFLVALIALGMALGASQRRAESRGETPRARIALIQPDVDAAVLNDPGKGDDVFSAYLEETKAFLRSSAKTPDLVVWPEMVFPFALNAPGSTRERLFESLAETGYRGEILIGGPARKHPERYFNSAILFQGGRERDVYEKEKLFPIGEYVPFHDALASLKRHLPFKLQMAEYSAGEHTEPIRFLKGRAGITICLESLYTDLVRRRVRDGAELLLNLTNDAWFAGSYAEEGHFYFGAMRAIENGRAFLQSASRGMTGMADRSGRIVLMTDAKGSVEIEAPLYRTKTLYTRLGWWRFPVLLLLTALTVLFYRLPGAKRES